MHADIVVVDFSNYANTLNEQVEGEKAPGDDDYDDGKASDKDDDGNIDCDDIALVDTYPNGLSMTLGKREASNN